MTPKISLVGKLASGFRRINWKEFVQSMANGAGLTIGTLVIYLIVVLIIFGWYRRSRITSSSSGQNTAGQNTAGQNIAENALTDALSYSRPFIVARDAGSVFSPTSRDTSWV